MASSASTSTPSTSASASTATSTVTPLSTIVKRVPLTTFQAAAWVLPPIPPVGFTSELVPINQFKHAHLLHNFSEGHLNDIPAYLRIHFIRFIKKQSEDNKDKPLINLHLQTSHRNGFGYGVELNQDFFVKLRDFFPFCNFLILNCTNESVTPTQPGLTLNLCWKISFSEIPGYLGIHQRQDPTKMVSLSNICYLKRGCPFHLQDKVNMKIAFSLEQREIPKYIAEKVKGPLEDKVGPILLRAVRSLSDDLTCVQITIDSAGGMNPLHWCHASILKNWSPIFAEEIRNPKITTSDGFIRLILSHLSYNGICYFKSFLYGIPLPVKGFDADMLVELFMAASQYEIGLLEEKIGSEILQRDTNLGLSQSLLIYSAIHRKATGANNYAALKYHLLLSIAKNPSSEVQRVADRLQIRVTCKAEIYGGLLELK